MGIRARGNRLWFRLKGPDGKWQSLRSDYVVGEEASAKKAFRSMTDRVAAGADIIGDRKTALTVKEYADLKWFAVRQGQLKSPEREEGRLRLHVFPGIGALPLEEVRARHLAELFNGLRKKKELAPKSIHNVYAALCALFRDAEIDGIVDKTPCILTEHQLGKNIDLNPEWRASAVFKREELVQLISDERIPMDRRVMYALLGVGALRHGEAAGLRFRHIDTSTEPLSRLMVATSYNVGLTKTDVARYMPIHPALAGLLAEWKLSGWREMMGRMPAADDLVVPTPDGGKGRGRRLPRGSMRKVSYSWPRFSADLELLGMRHRRAHDLRRTMISLARSDGAIKDILKRGTHKPPKEVIEGYTTFEWDVLCREVAKLNLVTPRRGQLLAMPVAVGSRSLEPRYTAVTTSAQPPDDTGETVTNEWGCHPHPDIPPSSGMRSNAAVGREVTCASGGLVGPDTSARSGGGASGCNDVTAAEAAVVKAAIEWLHWPSDDRDGESHLVNAIEHLEKLRGGR